MFKVVMAAVLVASLCLGSVARGFAQEATGRPFITKWQGKAGEELRIPIIGAYYDLVIKNERGKVVKKEENVSVYGVRAFYSFTPQADGVYTVEVSPEGVRYMRMQRSDPRYYFFSSDELIEVVQFGTVAWESMKDMFFLCKNMTFAANIDTPDLTKVTDMSRMFAECKSFNQPLNHWDVSKVTDMREMFKECKSFNQPLNNWDVSKVTDMREMFKECRAFNQPLNNWNVSNVTDMSGMFGDCDRFNQPLNHWNVSNVTDMSRMFEGCDRFNQPLNNWNVSNVTNMSGMFGNWKIFEFSTFNQPLDNWDVSKVTDMSEMFHRCRAFNQPLNHWNVSQVTNMSGMFADCSDFNQPLEKWNVGNVTGMSGMFHYCWSFNQPLDNWDVSQVTKMSGMFEGCRDFNQPLNNWNVGNVTNMSGMFEGCWSFNQPLDNWDVSQVTDMSGMFAGCKSFNQPLEKWDVSKVTKMSRLVQGGVYVGMFKNCSVFNQPLEKWDVSQVTDMGGMFEGCSAFNQPLGSWKLRTAIDGLSTTAMSVENYSQSLIGWAKQTDGATTINFGEKVKGLVYNDAGKEAREKLIARGWRFEGDIFYQLSEKVAITLVTEGEGTVAIESYNDEALKAVAVGTELTVTATPKEGYTLTSLIADKQDILATKKFTVKGAVTVKAVFKKKAAITLVKEGEGTLAIKGYNDDALNAVAVGTELTVIATPNDGYTLTSLTAGTQDILAAKKFTVKGAVTVKAVFKEIEKVAITLAKEGEGTLAIEGYNDEALKAVEEGTELTVTATPKDGYTLTALTAGTQDILATKKFTVTGAVTVKAVFTKNGGSNPGGGSTTFAVTLAKEGEGTLAIEGYNDAALQAVEEGTELTVIATPKDGYTLTALTAGTQDILATKKFTVTGAVTVKAVFKKNGNNGGGNGGGGWQPQTPQAVEDAVLASVVVAPNPFTAQLRIENPEGVVARYELVNAAGVVVRTGAFVATEVIVDTEALAAGVYFVRIEAQNGAKRVVKVSKC